MSLSEHCRIAFFGGSFDPPHRGHLAVARAACKALALDRVLFAPVAVQPLKTDRQSSGFEDRAAMTRLAIAGEPGFELSLIDAPTHTGAPNYTYETLRRLRAGLPEKAALFCLIGADSFQTLRHWRCAAQIPLLAPLIVASRPGQPLHLPGSLLPDGLRFLNEAPAESCPAGVPLCTWTVMAEDGRRAPFYMLPGLHEEVSATQIREQIRSDGGDEELLARPVLEHIRQHGLYHSLLP
jgi:nicotinate-nucleotide adenylyltransferase